MRAIAIAAVFALVPLAGCARDNDSGNDTGQTEEGAATGTVSGSGTISWRDIEGGFYVIESDDGTTYDPINLAPRYREDGLRVRFEAKLRTDLMSTHMAGTLIEITEVRELPPGPDTP